MPIDPGQVQWDSAQLTQQGGGVIITDPTVATDEARKASAEGRADRAEGRAERAEARADVAADRGTEAQQKVGTLLTRIKGGFSDIQSVISRNPEAQEPGLSETVRGDLMPGGWLGVPARKLAGEDRRIVHDSQRDVLDALLTLSTGAAYAKEQLTGQMASYFPQYGDTEAEAKVKNDRMLRLIEAAKVNAGPQWGEVEAAITPFLGRAVATGGTEAGAGGNLSPRDLEFKGKLEKAWGGGATIDQLDALSREYTGQPIATDQRAKLEGLPPKSPVAFKVSPTGQGDTHGMTVTGAYFVGAANALTSGMMDELAPALGMDANQVQQAKEMLREKYPVPSFVGEVTGSALQMAGATKALGAAGMAAPKAAAVAEIGGGAAYGAGESNEERLGGAAFGAGAALAGRQLGQMVFGAPQKQAIAAAAEKAGVPPEAMERVLADVMAPPAAAADAVETVAQPLTATAQEEIGAIARKAVGRGKPARDAKKQLAEMAKINPDAQAAAERMGVTLPLDILSDDAQLKTITGLARSQIGSEAQAGWNEAVARTAQQADEALDALGASPDLAQASADVMTRMDGAMKGLESQAKALRTQVDDAIDVRGAVNAQNLQRVLAENINDYGGLSEAKQAFSGEEKKLLAMLGEGESAKSPTYARLNHLRDEIGRALFKGQGPWTDTAQANLKRYYGALADDQLAHVRSVGGDELAEKMRGSNTLFSQMYNARDEMQAIFGDGLQKDLAPLINRTITKASKGDAEDLRKLLTNVPKDMHGSVLMSGLMAQATSKASHGGFSFANFAKTYRGLRQNAPIYKEFADAVGPQGAQVLTDLYAISRRMAEGEGRIVRTGASNQPLLNALNAESLLSKTMKGAAGKVAAVALGTATGGLAGRTAAETIADSAAQAMGTAGKTRLEKLHHLLASEPFRELVEKTGTGQDAKRSFNRVVGSKEYNSYAARVLRLRTPEQRRQWLQEATTASSAIGATRATQEPAPSASTVEVIPQ